MRKNAATPTGLSDEQHLIPPQATAFTALNLLPDTFF
jgi:hypothetical protein